PLPRRVQRTETGSRLNVWSNAAMKTTIRLVTNRLRGAKREPMIVRDVTIRLRGRKSSGAKPLAIRPRRERFAGPTRRRAIARLRGTSSGNHLRRPKALRRALRSGLHRRRPRAKALRHARRKSRLKALRLRAGPILNNGARRSAGAIACYQ